MKRFTIAFGMLLLLPEALLAADAATSVWIDRHGRVFGWGQGVGDRVHARCWTAPGAGRCVTISIDDQGDVAYSSSTAIKLDDEVRTATYNQAIDSQGRSSIGISAAGVAGAEAEAGAEGRAQAGGGVPVTWANSGDRTAFVQRHPAPAVRSVAPVQHMAPTREGRRNYAVGNQTPIPFAPAGYFWRAY